MTTVRILPAASRDAEVAASWYEEQLPGLGVEFLSELDEALRRTSEAPAAYQLQYKDVRRVLLRRFPFAVYFLYEKESVEVFAVLHQHMSSKSWLTRLE